MNFRMSNPSAGACLAMPAASLQNSFTANGSQPFSVFLRFLDANGTSHGSTSVAVRTS